MFPTHSNKVALWIANHSEFQKKIPIPTKIELPNNQSFQQFILKENIAFAVSTTGSVYIWGSINGKEEKEVSFVKTLSFLHTSPRLIDTIRNLKISAVTCNQSLAILLSDDGCLFSFGKDQEKYGLLGLGEVFEANNPLPMKSLFDHRIKCVSIGFSHACAVTSKGYLYTWGTGKKGQLGHKSIDRISTPLQVDSCKKSYISIAVASYNITCLLSTNGSVYVYGSLCNSTDFLSKNNELLKLMSNNSNYCSGVPICIKSLSEFNLTKITTGEGFIAGISNHGDVLWINTELNAFKLQGRHKIRDIQCLENKIYGISNDGWYLYEWRPPIEETKITEFQKVFNYSTKIYRLHDRFIKYSTFCDVSSSSGIAALFFSYTSEAYSNLESLNELNENCKNRSKTKFDILWESSNNKSQNSSIDSPNPLFGNLIEIMNMNSPVICERKKKFRASIENIITKRSLASSQMDHLISREDFRENLALFHSRIKDPKEQNSLDDSKRKYLELKKSNSPKSRIQDTLELFKNKDNSNDMIEYDLSNKKEIQENQLERFGNLNSSPIIANMHEQDRKKAILSRIENIKNKLNIDHLINLKQERLSKAPKSEEKTKTIEAKDRQLINIALKKMKTVIISKLLNNFTTFKTLSSMKEVNSKLLKLNNINIPEMKKNDNLQKNHIIEEIDLASSIIEKINSFRNQRTNNITNEKGQTNNIEKFINNNEIIVNQSKLEKPEKIEEQSFNGQNLKEIHCSNLLDEEVEMSISSSIQINDLKRLKDNQKYKSSDVKLAFEKIRILVIRRIYKYFKNLKKGMKEILSTKKKEEEEALKRIHISNSLSKLCEIISKYYSKKLYFYLHEHVLKINEKQKHEKLLKMILSKLSNQRNQELSNGIHIFKSLNKKKTILSLSNQVNLFSKNKDYNPKLKAIAILVSLLYSLNYKNRKDSLKYSFQKIKSYSHNVFKKIDLLHKLFQKIHINQIKRYFNKLRNKIALDQLVDRSNNYHEEKISELRDEYNNELYLVNEGLKRQIIEYEKICQNLELSKSVINENRKKSMKLLIVKIVKIFKRSFSQIFHSIKEVRLMAPIIEIEKDYKEIKPLKLVSCHQSDSVNEIVYKDAHEDHPMLRESISSNMVLASRKLPLFKRIENSIFSANEYSVDNIISENKDLSVQCIIGEAESIERPLEEIVVVKGEKNLSPLREKGKLIKNKWKINRPNTPFQKMNNEMESQTLLFSNKDKASSPIKINIIPQKKLSENNICSVSILLKKNKALEFRKMEKVNIFSEKLLKLDKPLSINSSSHINIKLGKAILQPEVKEIKSTIGILNNNEKSNFETHTYSINAFSPELPLQLNSSRTKPKTGISLPIIAASYQYNSHFNENSSNHWEGIPNHYPYKISSLENEESKIKEEFNQKNQNKINKAYNTYDHYSILPNFDSDQKKNNLLNLKFNFNDKNKYEVESKLNKFEEKNYALANQENYIREDISVDIVSPQLMNLSNKKLNDRKSKDRSENQCFSSEKGMDIVYHSIQKKELSDSEDNSKDKINIEEKSQNLFHEDLNKSPSNLNEFISKQRNDNLIQNNDDICSLNLIMNSDSKEEKNEYLNELENKKNESIVSKDSIESPSQDHSKNSVDGKVNFCENSSDKDKSANKLFQIEENKELISVISNSDLIAHDSDNTLMKTINLKLNIEEKKEFPESSKLKEKELTGERINVHSIDNIDILSQENVNLPSNSNNLHSGQNERENSEIEQSKLYNQDVFPIPDILDNANQKGKQKLGYENEESKKLIVSLVYDIIHEVIESSPDFSFIFNTIKSNEKLQNDLSSNVIPFLESVNKEESNKIEESKTEIIKEMKSEELVILKNNESENIDIIDENEEDSNEENEDQNDNNLNKESLNKSDQKENKDSLEIQDNKLIKQSNEKNCELDNSDSLQKSPENNDVFIESRKENLLEENIYNSSKLNGFSPLKSYDKKEDFKVNEKDNPNITENEFPIDNPSYIEKAIHQIENSEVPLSKEIDQYNEFVENKNGSSSSIEFKPLIVESDDPKLIISKEETFRNIESSLNFSQHENDINLKGDISKAISPESTSKNKYKCFPNNEDEKILEDSINPEISKLSKNKMIFSESPRQLLSIKSLPDLNSLEKIHRKNKVEEDSISKFKKVDYCIMEAQKFAKERRNNTKSCNKYEFKTTFPKFVSLSSSKINLINLENNIVQNEELNDIGKSNANSKLEEVEFKNEKDILEENIQMDDQNAESNNSIENQFQDEIKKENLKMESSVNQVDEDQKDYMTKMVEISSGINSSISKKGHSRNDSSPIETLSYDEKIARLAKKSQNSNIKIKNIQNIQNIENGVDLDLNLHDEVKIEEDKDQNKNKNKNLDENKNKNESIGDKTEIAKRNIISNQIDNKKNQSIDKEIRNLNNSGINLENSSNGKVKEMAKKFINRRQNINNETSIQNQMSEKVPEILKNNENDIYQNSEEPEVKQESKENNIGKNEGNENKLDLKQKSFFQKNNSSINENIVNEINDILKKEDYNSNNFALSLKTNENPSLALPSTNEKNNEEFETINKEIYDIVDSSNKKDDFKSIEMSNIGIKDSEPYHDIIKDNPTLSNDLGLFGQAEPVEFGISPEPKSINDMQNVDLEDCKMVENLKDNNTPEKENTGRFDNARFMEAFTNCFVKFYTEMISNNGIEIENNQAQNQNQNSNNKSNMNENSKMKLESYRDEGQINKSGNTKSVSSLVSSGRKKNTSSNKINIKDNEKNEHKRKINNEKDKLSAQDINLLFKHRMKNLKNLKNMKNMQNSNPNLREAQILRKNYEISKLLGETSKRDKSNSAKDKRKNPPLNHPNIFPLKDIEAKRKGYGENSHNNIKNNVNPSSLCLNVNKQFVKELSAINHEINSSMDHPSVPRFKVPKLELVYKLASLKVQASPLNSGETVNSIEKKKLDRSQKLKFN